MEYTEEIHNLASRIDLNEIEEQLMARFINGVETQLKEKVILESPASMIKAITMPNHLEKQANKYSHYSPWISTSKNINPRDRGLLPIPTDKEGTTEGKGKGIANTEIDWNTIKCYRCNEFYHKSKTSPKRWELRILMRTGLQIMRQRKGNSIMLMRG